MALDFDISEIKERVEMTIYTFTNLTHEERTKMFNGTGLSNDVVGSMFDACQGMIDMSSIEPFIFWAKGESESDFGPQRFDHLVLLTLDHIIISFAILVEKSVTLTEDSVVKYLNEKQVINRVRFDFKGDDRPTKRRSIDSEYNSVSLKWDKFMYIELICSPVKGVGTHMLKACETLSVRRGITIMSLTSIPSAFSFYRKHGYSEKTPSTVCEGVPSSSITSISLLREIGKLYDNMKTPDNYSQFDTTLNPVSEYLKNQMSTFMSSMKIFPNIRREHIEVIALKYPLEFTDIAQAIVDSLFIHGIDMSKCLLDIYRKASNETFS